MVVQCSVHGHQLEVLDLALGQQEPIERIASLRLGVGRDDHMARSDRLDRKPGSAPAG